jgi:acyl transferase domain-containing protein
MLSRADQKEAFGCFTRMFPSRIPPGSACASIFEVDTRLILLRIHHVLAATKKIIFLFSGQGSQYYGMGRELYEQHAGFRSWMDRGSEIAERLLGISLSELIYAKRESGARFERTLYTHPAIFLLSHSLAMTLREEGITPSSLVGYSLGETTAWTVAGGMSFETAMDYVVRVARIVEEKTSRGSMLAILAPPSLWEDRREIFEGATLVGSNYSQHFVITGLEEDLARTQSWLKSEDVISQMLPVQHGWHSPLLESAKDELMAVSPRVAAHAAKLQVVSCAESRVLDPEESGPEYWWRVLRDPIKFTQAILEMEKSPEPRVYIDVGPSGTLAGFVKNIIGRDNARAHMVLTPFGRDMRQLARLKEELGM